MAARAPKSHRNEWTPADLRQLKSLAKAKTPTSKIASTMGRTARAIYQKASTEGIRFAGARRASRRG